MKIILRRKKKIYSDKNISEMVRKISEEILSENCFGLSVSVLFEKVREEVFQKTRGYDLNSGHFILSILKSSTLEMMQPYEPFVVKYLAERIVINLEKNTKMIESLVLRIQTKVRVG